MESFMDDGNYSESDYEFDNSEDDGNISDLDLTKEMDMIQTFDCKCHQRRKENWHQPAVSCSQKLNPEFIYRTRLNTASLSTDKKDMLVLGTILTSINESENYQSINTAYKIHNIVVCCETFCFVLGISKNLLQSILQSYKKRGVVPRQGRGKCSSGEEEETGLGAVDKITVDTTDVKKEMDTIQSFDCKCQLRRKGNWQQPVVSCSQKLSAELVYNTRLNKASLSRDNRDMLLLGTILTSINDSQMTQSQKKVPTKRKRQRTTYTIHNTVICRETFCFVLRISIHLLLSLVQSYKRHGAVPRHRRRGPQINRNSLKDEDIKKVAMFITNYAEDHANSVLPGRHPGRRDLSAKLLPSTISQASVWRFYKDALEELGERVVSLYSFRRLWKTLLPQITNAKSQTDLC